MRRSLQACGMLVVLAAGATSSAQTTDYERRDFVATTGTVLTGDHVNIGTFTVPAGANVNIDGAVTIHADIIVIEGALIGDATGGQGGFERDECSGADTLQNPQGPGGGGVGGYGDPWPTAQAGGGGGHGAAGGVAELLAAPTGGGIGLGQGGAAYGSPDEAFSIDVGSGGGRGVVLCCPCQSGRGGRGGGAVALRGASSISILGAIRVNGGDGTGVTSASVGASGGGSGGGVIIDSPSIDFQGTIEARGGAGGSRTDTAGNGDIGGGGAGGRVRFFGSFSMDTGTVDVSGGGSDSEQGNSGTIHRGPVAADIDGDGVPNAADTCPNDHLNDQDGDGLCANVDPCPTDDDNDSDSDGLCIAEDNCPTVSNPMQENQDFDMLGDACDPDRDGDGDDNVMDNCPDISNPNQANEDGDELGDVCDPCLGDTGNDPDMDMVCAASDNCPDDANMSQDDEDSDSIGDACDPCLGDADNDSADDDGVCHAMDNCPTMANPDQEDLDSDMLGDVCDPDDDGDDIEDGDDNCPRAANPEQEDSDMDGEGDACDGDRDSDEVPNEDDNCVDVPNEDQLDTDDDGAGDECDDDDDDDGVLDDADDCRLVAASTSDGCPIDETDAGTSDGGTQDASLAEGDLVPKQELDWVCSARPGRGQGGVWVLALLGLAFVRRRRRRSGLWVLLLAAMALPSLASAQADDESAINEARTHFQLGRVNYNAGRFAEAAAEFEQAYELAPRPLLLYNIYLSRRDMGDTAAAADALSRYLENDNVVEGQERLRLERILGNLRQAAARNQAPPEEAEPEAAPPSDPELEAPPQPEPEPEPEPIEEPEPEPMTEPHPDEQQASSGSNGLLYAGIGVAAFGVVMGVTGVIMQVSMRGHSNELEDACNLGTNGDLCPADFDQQSIVDQFETKRTVRWVSFGLALAGIAGGVTLMLLGLGGDDDDSSVGVACGPDGCAGSYRRRF